MPKWADFIAYATFAIGVVIAVCVRFFDLPVNWSILRRVLAGVLLVAVVATVFYDVKAWRLEAKR
ncbi:MAG: hypothetical protein AAB676_09955 [Verrucomicrobiota bacterium]